MKENIKIELFGKLASESEISKILKHRQKRTISKIISSSDLNKCQTEGWEIDKKLKHSIKLKKLKSFDEAFEDEVWSLLASMGYKIMNRDRTFYLPYDKEDTNLTKQIDVFAKDDETILVVECKSSVAVRRGDFKKELESYFGIMEGLRKSLQALFPEGKYKFKFIFATKNLSFSDEDYQRLEKLNGVHLNEENIEYFYQLYNQIGVACRYQFLGNIFEGQEIPEMENKVPAVRGKMGGHTFYSFATEPENILKIGFVLHRNKANVNMMPTYQRIIKKSRLNSISNFIENGGYFPNSVVISINAKNCNFDIANTQVSSTISDVGILHLPKKYKSAYIIDGQHRLYGYSKSEFRYKNTIPVVAFVNLSREEQIILFMQINENQKNVSKSLRETLNADLKWTSDILLEQLDALSSRIGIYLGENKKSSLYDKIYIGEDIRELTQNNIKLALKRSHFFGKISKNTIEELGLIYTGDLDRAFEKLRDILVIFLEYLEKNLEKEWKEEKETIVLTNNGIYGLILILSDILFHINQSKILDVRKSNPKEIMSEVFTFLDPIIIYLKEISIDERFELKRSYGAGGQTKHWRTFQRIVQNTFPDFDPEGLKEYFIKQERQNNDRAFAIIREIETFFNKDFKEKLENKFGKMWFKKGVPPQISEDAVGLAYKKNLEVENEEDEIKPWDCINIIAYRVIALKNWQDIFERDYTKPGEEKISGGKEEKTKWMVKLESLRNQNVHSYFVAEEELKFLEELFDWIITKKIRNKFQAPNA
ncbi:MAG: DGQHR domain-containing protein [Bacteroidales bacterium]|nr:DGQHR domain-containing protein [Bacteroidales bacterium]